MKKIYIWIGLVIIGIIVAGIYWNFQVREGNIPSKTEEPSTKTSPTPETKKEVSPEELELSTKELETELDSFSQDLSDLQDFESEESLETLDDDLLYISE